MEIDNEALEFAYLMETTHSTYDEIFVYNKALDAYCATLDDEEPVDPEAMLEFIREHTYLNEHHIKEISDAQLKALKADPSLDEQCRLIRKMTASLSEEDKKRISPEFWKTVLEYLELDQIV